MHSCADFVSSEKTGVAPSASFIGCVATSFDSNGPLMRSGAFTSKSPVLVFSSVYASEACSRFVCAMWWQTVQLMPSRARPP